MKCVMLLLPAPVLCKAGREAVWVEFLGLFLRRVIDSSGGSEFETEIQNKDFLTS